MVDIERRTLLAMGGSALVGAAAGGMGVGAVMRSRREPPPARPVGDRADFDTWRRTRKPPYFIAHRGAGDVVPEHTAASYQAALDWGADVLEISVVRSADNVLYCMHDLTLDRTTAARGLAAQVSSSVLDETRVTVPRLGPRWVEAQLPVPRVSDVLAAVGGKAVLCIEAKDDSAFPLLIKEIEAAGLKGSVVIKMTAGNGRLKAARAAGYPVFAYFGNAKEATKPSITKAAASLGTRDVLVLPARDGLALLDADLVTHAVDTGMTTWVAPVHRRYEAKYFNRLGAEGLVTPDLGYQTGSVPVRLVDDWGSGGLSPGELTRDPYSDAFALDWQEEGVIGLGSQGRPSFLTLGQFCPIQAESYRIVFDATFDPLPSDTWQGLSIAFGHVDDRYYEHRGGAGDGYHAQLRADGSMGIYAHVEGDPNGQLISQTRASTPFRPALWARLTLDVTPELIRWSRDDGISVEAHDSRFRGGYIHVGRSGNDGVLKVRNLTVT